MKFSLRRLLGFITAVCLLLAVYQCAVSAERKKQFKVYGCLLALVSAALPAVLAAGVAGTTGYSRAAMIGGLVPALLAAVVFALALANSQSITTDPWLVITQTFYCRHRLVLLWSLVPICGAGGIVAHWFLAPSRRE